MGFAFLLWLVSFQDFFLKNIRLFPDGHSYMFWSKFFLDNISRGVYPTWFPLENWGYPIGYKLRFLGEYNPAYFFLFILYKLGLGYSAAYFCFAVSYFFLGVVGFYLIAQRLLNSRILGFAGFLLLLFSSIGINVFYNFCVIVLFVPLIWFFFFLIDLNDQPNKQNFLGLTFTLMLIMTTYMPFYFLTVFLAFLILFVILFPSAMKRIILKTLSFVKMHWIFSGLCLAAVGASVLPGVFWFLEAGSGELAFDQRQSQSGIDNIATLGFDMISLGTIVGPLTIRRLFSGIAHQSNQLSYFYLSVFIYPVLLLSLINKINKRMILYFGVGLGMFILSLTDITPVHQFLYDKVFYFKLIRNIYYHLQLAMPFIILFILEQLKIIFSYESKSTRVRILFLLLILASSFSFYIFLKGQGAIIQSSYVTVLGSLIFFSLYFFNIIRGRKRMMMILLFGLIVAQPLQVFYYYCQNAETRFARFRYRDVPETPTFYYTRPTVGEDRGYPHSVLVETTGFGRPNYMGSIWSNHLLKSVNHRLLEQYVQYKLIVYDRVEIIEDENIPWPKVGATLSQFSNIALVSDKEAKLQQREVGGTVLPWAQKFTEDTNELEVLEFTLNSIKLRTNFGKRKFLVYNDSYHSGWKAWVNNQKAPLYRANIAFKGLWLEPGENIVTLRYGQMRTYILNFLLLILFYIMFAYLLVLTFKLTSVDKVRIK